MLRVEGLSVAYGELVALREISLAVEDGETVALIGSNGAGKTTLLRAICGLMRARGGAISFCAKRVDLLSPRDICAMGLIQVPEGRRLFPQMTVLENLEMGAYLLPARRLAPQSLEMVYDLFPVLQERRRQKAGLLSGGEQQMLAIGRALMARPRLLLLDEPTLGLAPKVISDIFEVLKDLGRRGTTILLASEEVIRALGIAHRGYVLENGRIVMENDGASLLDDARLRQSYLGL